METEFVNEEGEEYKLFLALHTAALKAARIPPLYWKSLHYKLKHEVKTRTWPKLYTGVRETAKLAARDTYFAVN